MAAILKPPVPGDVQLTSLELAARWKLKREGSLRMMRVKNRGPRWITLGKAGKGKRPRVRYWLSDIMKYEQEHGRPA